MSITTVLLDAGGVILDESQYEVVRAELTAEILSGAVPGYSVDCYFSDVEDAVQSYCANVYQYIFWKRSNGNVELFNTLWSVYLERFGAMQPPLKLSDGLRTELESLSSEFNLGIAGKYGRELLDALRYEDVLDMFRFPFTQDDFPYIKPDSRYFECVAEACHAAPEECVMVGDRVDNDIVPAKMLGMKTVLIRTGLHRGQQTRSPLERPDAELGSIAGLGAAIRRIAMDERLQMSLSRSPGA